jgi:fatty-acyl-CoA synthase
MAKDVIKSGGAWIATVELETRLMAHPDLLEAVVTGLPRRPLARATARVRRPRRGFVGVVRGPAIVPQGPGRRLVAPRARWTFLPEVPVTSVGKFDKKVLRARNADDLLSVETIA